MGRLLSLIRSVFPVRSAQQVQPPADTTDVVAAAEVTVHDGLDPEALMDKPVGEVLGKLKDLAQSYEPGRVSDLFGQLAEWFEDLWSEYLVIAERRFSEILRTVRRPFAMERFDSDARNSRLRTDVKAALKTRARQIEQLRARIIGISRDVRTLTIGIWGNPGVVIPAKNRIDEILAIGTAFAATLTIDMVFNATLLRYVSNSWIAIAFSFTVSLTGSLFAYWAAISMKRKYDWRNAEQERETFFAETRGIDPETGKEARVFPLPSETRLHIRLGHVFLVGLCTGTVVYRWLLSSSLGELAGSFGFVLVLVCLYMYELTYGKPNHPRAAEYHDKKRQTAEAEAEIKKLGDFTADDPTKELFDGYNRDVDSVKTRNSLGLDAWKKTRELFLDLARQFGGTKPWLVAQFDDAVDDLTSRINHLSEDRDALDAAIDEERPQFEPALPFDLTEAVREAESIAAIEPGEIEGRITDFETLRSGLWTEALDEERRETENARRAENEASARTADELARAVRQRAQAGLNRWRPRIRPRGMR